MKVMGPKGKGSVIKSVKHLLSICPMPGSMIEAFHTYFLLHSH